MLLKNPTKLLVTGLVLNASALPSKAVQIDYPEYNNIRIDACVDNWGCGESATDYAANKYCQRIGYNRKTYWETKTYKPKRRRKTAWKLEYRASGSKWFTHKGGYLFSRIDCSY